MDCLLGYMILESAADWFGRFGDLVSAGVTRFHETITRNKPMTPDQIFKSPEWKNEWFVVEFQNEVLKLDNKTSIRLPAVTGIADVFRL